MTHKNTVSSTITTAVGRTTKPTTSSTRRLARTSATTTKGDHDGFLRFHAGDLVAMYDKYGEHGRWCCLLCNFEYFMLKVIWNDRVDAEWVSEQKIYPYKMVAEQIKDWRTNDRDKDEE